MTGEAVLKRLGRAGCGLVGRGRPLSRLGADLAGDVQLGQVLNILQVAAFLGVIATGQTLVVLTGGIDLSQAGVVTLTNIVAASMMAGSADEHRAGGRRRAGAGAGGRR